MSQFTTYVLDTMSGQPSAGFIEGEYQLVFHVAEYFRARGVDPPFLDRVVLRVGLSTSAQPYHVPVLVSPWRYSMYRRS